jgi:hypothetical protein
VRVAGSKSEVDCEGLALQEDPFSGPVGEELPARKQKSAATKTTFGTSDSRLWSALPSLWP